MPPSSIFNNSKIHWLLRIVWLITAIYAGYFYILDFPNKMEIYQSICTDLDNCLEIKQLSSNEAEQLEKLGLSLKAYAGFKIILDILNVFIFFGVSAILLFRKEQPLFNLYVSVVFLSLGIGLSYNFLNAHPETYFMYHFISNFGGTYLVLFYLMPNGKFVPKWTVFIALFWILIGVFSIYFKGSFLDLETWPIELGAFCWISFHVILIFSQIYRYIRKSDSTTRQQMKWYLYSIIMYVIALLMLNFLGPLSITLKLFTEFLYGISAIFIPLSIGFAIFKYRLWDINIIIHRTVLYGSLSLLVILFYSFSVSIFSHYMVEEDEIVASLITTGMIAICFHPVKVKLQLIVNRLVYGNRDNPLLILTELNSILSATSSMDKVLPLVVNTLSKTLKIPYVAIQLYERGSHYIAASTGTPSQVSTDIPLIYQGNPLGSLLLSSRHSQEPFRPSDIKLISDLAQQVSIVANSILLHKDLQWSRSQLVKAREEERRRLRRDLHDGLGPSLASLKMKLDVAESFIIHQPEKAATIIKETGIQIKQLIEDIRTLVYSLRPPVLDELGLLSAIRELCNQYYLQSIRFTVQSEPDPLPMLPAASEMACFRIAQEAITNVVRHSSAKHCVVEFKIQTDKLRLTITDDGKGISNHIKKGIGLQSMKERAEELGGTTYFEVPKEGGTRIVAEIPI